MPVRPDEEHRDDGLAHPGPPAGFDALCDQVLEALRREDGAQALRLARRTRQALRDPGQVAELELSQVLEALALLLQPGDEPELNALEWLQVLRMGRRLLGPAHIALSSALCRLAALRERDGENARSTWILLERALAIARTAGGPASSPVRTVIADMQRVLDEHELPPGAFAHHERMLAIKQQVYGSESAEMARSFINYSHCAHQLGYEAIALDLWRRGLAVAEVNIGPEHAELATWIQNAAFSLRESDPQEAMALYELAFDIMQRATGPAHEALRSLALERASLLEAQGEFQELDSWFQHWLGLLEAKALADGGQCVWVLREWAHQLALQRRFAEAEGLALRVIGILERRYGAQHEDIPYDLLALAEWHIEQGKADLALPHLLRVVAISRQASHVVVRPVLREALTLLAQCHQQSGDRSAAERILRADIGSDQELA